MPEGPVYSWQQQWSCWSHPVDQAINARPNIREANLASLDAVFNRLVGHGTGDRTV